MKRKKAEGFSEDARQFLHIAFGIFIIGVLYFLGKQFTLLFLLAFICFSLLIINLRLIRVENPFDFIFNRLERRGHFPGKGALFYLVGLLFLVSFSFSPTFERGTIAILAVGDGASTLFGRRGKNPLSWNPKKTVEGLAAFLLFGFISSFYFFGILGAALCSLVLGLVETLDLGIDDNLSIPIAAVVLSLFLNL
ncbi:hypothetical protein HY991_04250 [Candidatus Micrarchaeota archaeon]|nr:hypothetical protein [Candidatus Micrarchaeota archaeon]